MYGTPVQMKTKAFYTQQIEYLSQYIETNVVGADGQSQKRFDPGLMACLLMVELLSDVQMLLVQIANKEGAVSTKHPLMP